MELKLFGTEATDILPGFFCEKKKKKKYLLTNKHQIKIADLSCQRQQAYLLKLSNKLYSTIMVLLFANLMQIVLILTHPYSIIVLATAKKTRVNITKAG